MGGTDAGLEMLIRQACSGVFQDRETSYRVRLLRHGSPCRNISCRVYPEQIGPNDGRIFKERRLDETGAMAGDIRYLSSFLDFSFIPVQPEELEPFTMFRVEVFRPFEDLALVAFDLDCGSFFLTNMPEESGTGLRLLMDHQPGWSIKKLSVSCAKNPPIHVSSRSSNQIAFFEKHDGNRYIISTDVKQYLSAWIGFFPVLPRPGDEVDFSFQVEFMPPGDFIRTEPKFREGGDVQPPEYRIQPHLESGQIPESEPMERVTVFFHRRVALTAAMLP